MGLERVVAVINGKGGVGKTSLVANLAGEFAASGGMRVLVVDLDVSRNLVLDFGLVGHEEDDQGRGVFQAIVGGGPLGVVPEIRDNIDWIPGGAALNWVSHAKLSQEQDLVPGGVDARWRELLTQAAQGYDMVLLDCPPGNRQLQEMALAAAKWLLVPSKSDAASWEGLTTLGPLVRNAREGINPDIEWLGVVLFAHQSKATRVRRAMSEQLEGSTIPFLQNAIRASESVAQECRSSGLLVREVVAAAPTQREVFAALRARRHDPQALIPKAASTISTSLAEDYRALAEEIADKIIEAEGITQ